MNDAIEPSWSVFGPCPRCGAADGAPCRDMRLGDWPHWSHLVKRMRNPHPGRRKARN